MSNRLAAEGKTYFFWSLDGQGDQTYLNGPRLRDIKDGKWLAHDPITYEYRDVQGLFPVLSLWALSPFVLLTKTVSDAAVIIDITFFGIIFFLQYLLFRLLTRRVIIPAFFAVFFTVQPIIGLIFPPFTLDRIRFLLSAFSPFGDLRAFEFIQTTRIESFAPNYAFLLAFLIFWAASLRSTRRIFPVLAGISFGLLFYTYPYHWMYSGAAIACYTAIVLLKKDRRETVRVLTILVIGLLVSIPYWFSVWRFMHFDNAQEIILRQGIELGHNLRVGGYVPIYVASVLLAVLLLYVTKNKKSEAVGTFAASLLFANLLVLNYQVLTGTQVQVNHWTIRAIFIGFNVVFLILAWLLADRPGRKRTAAVFSFICLTLICVLFVRTYRYQMQLADHRYQIQTIDPSLVEAFDWINGNVPADSVIATRSLRINLLLPAYTHVNLFMPDAYLSLASQEEILERMFMTYRLSGVTPEAFSYIFPSEKETSLERQGGEYFFAYSLADTAQDATDNYHDIKMTLTDSKREKLQGEYAGYRLTPDMLSKYRLDYFLLDKNDHGQIIEGFSKSFQKVFENDQIEIYQFSGNGS